MARLRDDDADSTEKRAEKQNPHTTGKENARNGHMAMDKTTPWDMAKTTRHVEADDGNAGKNPQPKRRHKPTYNEIKLKINI